MSDISGDELRKILSTFRAELKADHNKDVQGLHAIVKQEADRTIAAQESTRRQVVHLTQMTYSLWRKVRGSEPPPPPPSANDDISFTDAARAAAKEKQLRQTGSQKPVMPLDDLADEIEKTAGKVSSHDNDIAGVTGRLLAVESQTAEVLRLQKEQMGKKDTSKKDERGPFTRLVDGLVWAVRDREGQKTVGAVVAGITGIITALGTWYALLTGRLPLPNTPAQPAHALTAPAPAPPPPPPLHAPTH